jgi:metal-sulfur cluster biosynthetic enzyme
MNQEVQKKIDGVLERVKEQSSLLPVSELGLVRKVSCSEADHKILIEMAGPGDNRACICAGLVGDMLRGSVERELQEEFKKEFAGFSVEFA